MKIRIHLIVILENVFNLKNIFEKISSSRVLSLARWTHLIFNKFFYNIYILILKT